MGLKLQFHTGGHFHPVNVSKPAHLEFSFLTNDLANASNEQLPQIHTFLCLLTSNKLEKGPLREKPSAKEFLVNGRDQFGGPFLFV